MAASVGHCRVNEDAFALDLPIAVAIGHQVRTRDGRPFGTITEVTGSGFRVIGRRFIGWLRYDAVRGVEGFATMLECDTAGLPDFEYDGESSREDEAYLVIGATR